MAPPALSAPPDSKVLAFLNKISGHYTVGGVHNDQKVGGVAYYTDRLASVTGKVPGLWGGDFSYDGRMRNRWAMIREAEKQWNAGALVNIMWHACPPTRPEPCSWDGDVKSRLSDAEWRDLVTDGGSLNRTWKRRMDTIATYLKHLDDRGVEVLWRPIHEMNQWNFWWGGRSGPDGTARLYRLTHDYLTRVKGLRNLVWTWDVQDLRFDWDGYHPGDGYFDVMALDMYSMGYTDSLYNSMLRLAGGKPIGLGEVGRMPTPQELERHPRYAFVMGWAYMTFDENPASRLSALFNAPNVLTRDEMPGWANVNGVPVAHARGADADGLVLETGRASLSLRLAGSGPARARLSGLDGRSLRVASSGKGRLEIPTAGLPGGVYLITVETGGRSLSRRVVLPP